MIDFAVLTKPGGRAVNEDSVATAKNAGEHLFVLADGLGGHGLGEVASAAAAAAAVRVFQEGKAAPGELLPQCIAHAQNALVEEQRRTGRTNDIKTTITLLHIADGGSARWAHVGDSRVYQFIKDKVQQHTLDHSVPQMLVMQGEIRESDIRFHEDRNRLIRVLGMEWESPKFDLSPEAQATPGTSFLLCSDGFWELIDEKEMQKTLKAADGAAGWLAAMESIVLRGGQGRNMDNYSAIAVLVR